MHTYISILHRGVVFVHYRNAFVQHIPIAIENCDTKVIIVLGTFLNVGVALFGCLFSTPVAN